MLDGGFKLRKWMTNDASVRGKIESDSSDVVTREVVEEDVTNVTTVTKKTKSDSNVEVTHKAVSEEDISYAKSSCWHADGVQGPEGAGVGLGLRRRHDQS